MITHAIVRSGVIVLVLLELTHDPEVALDKMHDGFAFVWGVDGHMYELAISGDGSAVVLAGEGSSLPDFLDVARRFADSRGHIITDHNVAMVWFERIVRE